MATNTEKLNLKKPSKQDFYDIEDFNENFQKIDDFAKRTDNSTTETNVRIGNDKSVGSGGVGIGDIVYALINGVAIGKGAKSAGGVAIGDGALCNHGYGVAIGNGANTIVGGGAVGRNAETSDGGAVGYEVKSSSGGAVGRNAETSDGGAVGYEAKSSSGGAVGRNAETSDGGAVGNGAKTGNGFAGGKNALSSVDDAIQLGTGKNTTNRTFQVYDYRLLNENGTIPNERLPIAAGCYFGGGTYGSGSQNTISFPFAPKVIFISAETSETPSYFAPMPIIQNSPTARINFRVDASSDRCYSDCIYLIWGSDGKSLSWYSLNDTYKASMQLNATQVKYNWVAIG